MALLWLQTQVFTAAVLLVALLRLAVRRAFGAQAAYLVWGLVPALAAAALWPLAALKAPSADMGLGVLQAMPRAMGATLPGAAPGVSWAQAGLGLWGLGVAVMLLGLLGSHRRLRHVLQANPGRGGWQLPAGQSLALLGFWQPRLGALPTL